MRYSSHIPEPLRRAPRGGGIFSIIALIITAVLTGGIGVGIFALIDSQSCLVNVFWGCGSDTGTNVNGSILCVSAPNSCGQRNVGTLSTSDVCPSGSTGISPSGSNDCPAGASGMIGGCGAKGGTCTPACTCYALDSSGNYIQQCSAFGKGGQSCGPETVPNTTVDTCSATAPLDSQCVAAQPCTSAPNACGQTSAGTLTNGVCNASTPSNASCPAPAVSGFSAQPSVLHGGGVQGVNPPPNNGTTLFWDTTNTTSCTITGDNGFSFSTTQPKGSVGTGTLWDTTTFTLNCEDGAGGPNITRSLKVLVDPHYKEI